MNREGRRKLGFTEPRYRKFDRGTTHWYDDLFKFYHKAESYKLGNTEQLRLDRLEGKPRRWQMERCRRRSITIEELHSLKQVERSRRKLQQLIQLEIDLGLVDYG